MAVDPWEITPSRKRFVVNIRTGETEETFKTQKSLCDRVKPMFEYLHNPQNQAFMKAFVETYDKVKRQGKNVKRVEYRIAEGMPSHFKSSKCLHVCFEDGETITVSYRNVIVACFDPERAVERKQKSDRTSFYREQIARDVQIFRHENIGKGCAICRVDFFEAFDTPCPHVDHTGEKEFRHIVADFENLPLKIRQEEDFATFHRRSAQYQMLCEDCHIKKPKKW